MGWLQHAIRLFFSAIMLFGTNIFAHGTDAQTTQSPARAMLVLDASNSMWGRVEGVEKIAVARTVIGDLMSQWDPSVHIGLTAYGHRRKGDCTDIEVLTPVGPGTHLLIPDIVNSIGPKGKTPLSDAVRRAAEEIRYTEEPATVILVTDGLETCDADPCAVAEALEAAGVGFTAHVIGFDITEEESRSVRCVAEKTGGQYHSARTADELREALRTTTAAPPPIIEEVEPDPANNTDKIRLALVEGGPLLTDNDLSRPISGGSYDAEFTFFAVDQSGMPTSEQLAQNFGWAGSARVPPGDVSVVVNIGLVEASAIFSVQNNETEHVLVLNAGMVKMTPIIADGTLSLNNTLKWTVQSADVANAPVLETQIDHGIGGIFIVPPGNYIFRGEISGVKKSVPLQIVAGDKVSIDVDMRSGTARMQAALMDGAPPDNGQFGNFQWEAYAPGPDGLRGEKLTSTFGSVSTMELPVGRNIIVFRDKVVERQFTIHVADETTTEFVFAINAAIIQYRVVDETGDVISGYPSINVYPQGADTTKPSPLGYFGNIGPAGTAYVPAEPLTVVVQLSGQRYEWPLELPAGQATAVEFKIEQ